jgi:hypothetical protein
MKSGVYKITCGRYFYIGSTTNFDRRWGQHQAALKAKRHCNQFMQNLWNKTRGHGFKFEVLIGCCGEEQLTAREQELIDFHWGDKSFMNLNPKADRVVQPKGYRHSAEVRKRIARPGASNPRATPITVVFTDGTVKHYDYMTLLANELGVKQATVGRWLNGVRNPSKKFRIKEITRGHL